MAQTSILDSTGYAGFVEIEAMFTELYATTGGHTTEVDAIETGAGLDTDGSYIADATADYISGATSLANADSLLDDQVKANTTSISALAAGSGVMVSANDASIGYLNGKIVAGSSISLTENNDGGSETLTVACTYSYDPTEDLKKSFLL